MRETTGQSMGLGDAAETFAGRYALRPHPGDRGPRRVRRSPGSIPRSSQPMKSLLVDAFEEALVRVKGGDYDLLVVSLGMRGFDGLAPPCALQLRSLPEGRNVPILVVVSDGDRRKLTQALEMGVNDYLTRPVDKNELGGAGAHSVAQEALCRPAAPQCAAQLGDGDHRPACHRPAQSPLYEPPSRHLAGKRQEERLARSPSSSWTSISSRRSMTAMAMTSETRC